MGSPKTSKNQALGRLEVALDPTTFSKNTHFWMGTNYEILFDLRRVMAPFPLDKGCSGAYKKIIVIIPIKKVVCTLFHKKTKPLHRWRVL